MASAKIIRRVWTDQLLAIAVLVPVLSLSLTLVFGQAGGEATLTGAVKDASGAVIPNVQVTVANTGTGLTTKTTTASNGTYMVPQLPVGNYTVVFSRTGFRSLTRNGIVLTASSVTTVDATLPVGKVVQNVTVSANAEMIQTGTSTLGRLFHKELCLSSH